MTIKYLDDKGKAIYGVPGPGAYETPSTMTNTARGARSGSPLRPESAPAGKGKFSLLLTAKLTGKEPYDPNPNAVYRSSPGYTMYSRSFMPDGNEGPRISPGPKYNPDRKPIEKSDGRAMIGTSTRDQQQKVYISKQHNETYAGIDAPGPGTYPIAKFSSPVSSMSSRVRNAPRAAMSSSERVLNPIPKSMLASPGPVYNPHPMWSAPTSAFCASSDPRKGALRDKAEASRVFVSRQFSIVENLVEAAKLPGPGQYPGANYALEYSSQYKRAGSTWMSTVPRIPKNNRYGGGGEQYTEADHSLPGPQYMLPSTLDKRGVTLGTTEPRMWEIGKGPIITHEHEDMRKCTQSPGVGAYDIKDPDAHKLGLGAPVFGNEPRPFELEDNGVPGPGAHKEPDITKRSDVRNSQRYSMAAGIRSDVAPAHSLAIPGPGTYDHLQPLLTQSSTKKTPKSLSMGPGSLNKAGGRASSAPRPRVPTMSSAVYPGPGAYENTKTAIQTGPNVGVSMKHKEKAKRYMGFGADQEWKGQESPGPGMDLRGMVSKGGTVPLPGFAFASPKRNPEMTHDIKRNPDKLYISECHAFYTAGMDSPGPQYNTASPGAMNSKFRHSGAFSFGSGSRTQFAKVTC